MLKMSAIHILLLIVHMNFVSSQEIITYLPKSDLNSTEEVVHVIKKRGADPTFRGNPKTREEMWEQAFIGKTTNFDQSPSLINLLRMLAMKHLNECTPVILYDIDVENSEEMMLEQLMRGFPLAYVHGRINENNTISESNILKVIAEQCVSYILFMKDVMKSADVVGLQATSKVVVVARSSQWRVHEFLYGKPSRNFVNLLVVAQSFRDDNTLETPYILYTHTLFVDGLGASKPTVLTSWSKGKLARPEVNLFPPKMTKGYAGHRFSVVAANQPPFVFKTEMRDRLGNPIVKWEGIEYRLINLLGVRNNFSIEIKEPEDLSTGSGDAVWKEVLEGRADIGMGGLYVTNDRSFNIEMSSSHSQDCAVFISLTSTALPRYRAIMGPFHWTVWVTLTFTYLFGIFPLAFSDKHTLRHLLHNSGEVENMFWYVFGTFTNCFTFVGKNSWSKTTKVTTRLLIGWYWIFTIIITACYTGSIIAFVTLPVYPATVDTVEQLISGHYRVGTLDKGGWDSWFLNSSDERTNKLLRHLELVPNIETGLANTTKAFFWPYAFLSSKYQLEYIVQTNYTLETSKRAVLHISDKCFVPFGVSLAFPKESVYYERLNNGILLMLQSGIISKLESDVKWKMQRSSTGKLLQASSGKSLRSAIAGERGLSLSDTQGMFLLLGAGFLGAGTALLSEWMGGCRRMFRLRNKKSSALSVSSSTTSCSNDSKSCLVVTPNDKENGGEYNKIYSTSQDSLKSIDGKMLSANNDLKRLVLLNDDAKSDNACMDDDICSKSDKNLNVQTVEIAADINHGTKIINKETHCRRSSYVDWDSEINDVFQCMKTEMSSDEETVEKKNPIFQEEIETKEKSPTKESVTDLFGEKITFV